MVEYGPNSLERFLNGTLIPAFPEIFKADAKFHYERKSIFSNSHELYFYSRDFQFEFYESFDIDKNGSKFIKFLISYLNDIYGISLPSFVVIEVINYIYD